MFPFEGRPQHSKKRRMLERNGGGTSAARWATCLLDKKFLSRLPDDLWTHGESWTVIGRRVILWCCQTLDRDTEFMPLWSPNLTWWRPLTTWISCSLIPVEGKMTRGFLETWTKRLESHVWKQLHHIIHWNCTLSFLLVFGLHKETHVNQWAYPSFLSLC